MTTMDAIMPTMPTDLGTLVANERQRLQWSLRDVTNHGGPPHNTVSMIEAGKSAQPDAATLWKLATAFAAGGAKKDPMPIPVGQWFAMLLRVAGYPLDGEADAAVAKLVSVLSSDRRRQILDMTPEDLDLLLSLYVKLRGGGAPPQ